MRRRTIRAVASRGGLPHQRRRPTGAARGGARRVETTHRFSYGDWVEDLDGERPGEVVFVGDYDDYIDGYRYKVREPDGTVLWRNEPNLRRLRYSARRSGLGVASRAGRPTISLLIEDGRGTRWAHDVAARNFAEAVRTVFAVNFEKYVRGGGSLLLDDIDDFLSWLEREYGWTVVERD